MSIRNSSPAKGIMIGIAGGSALWFVFIAAYLFVEWALQ